MTLGSRSRRGLLGFGLLLGALLAAAALSGPASAGIQIEQPPQPQTGPGGSELPHAGVRVSSGGEGADAWYVFEPVRPEPRKAPLAVVMHGYYEFEGYAQMEAFIEHTVRGGATVIYPRWQTDVAAPCPGPFDIEPCMESALAGINGALDYLRAKPSKRVQPQLRKTSYFGFSFGGIITANLLNRWRELDLPKPRAVFLDDPHDGGLTGADEPALDDDLGGIPRSTLFQCHAPANGVIAGTTADGESMRGGSCNAVFPKLTSIPKRNKDLVMTRSDGHGEPALAAIHGVCTADNGSGSGSFGLPNAYDWNFCWKVWDALRSCALDDKDCRYALGDGRKHRSLGRWSDGTPVKRLVVQDRAPVRP